MPKPFSNTLQAIAEATGFSRMTVSRVLRGAPHVHPETRRRILEAKDSLGYHPNPLISTLMAKVRSGGATDSAEIIAFVTAFDSRHGWERFPSIVRMRHGAEERARELGFRIEDFWLREPGLTPRRLSLILRTRGIHGVLVAPAPAYGFSLALEWEWFAAAALEFTMTEPVLHRVSGNRFESLRMAIREIWQRGYRRPGLFLRRMEDERMNDFWSAAAFLDNHRYRISHPVPPLLVDDYEEKAFKTWMKKHSPDCICGINSGVISWIEEMGLRVPEDVGFVHINLFPGDRGKLAGVNGRSESVGSAAVESIVGQIHRNEWGIPKEPRVVLVDGTWVDGQTLRTRMAAATPGLQHRE